MGKILPSLIIENRDLAYAQTFCTRVKVYILSFSAEFRHPVEGSLYAASHRRSTLKFIDFQ